MIHMQFLDLRTVEPKVHSPLLWKRGHRTVFVAAGLNIQTVSFFYVSFLFLILPAIPFTVSTLTSISQLYLLVKGRFVLRVVIMYYQLQGSNQSVPCLEKKKTGWRLRI